MELTREFEKAGLQLQLPGNPIVDTNREIVQLDIRANRGREWFRLWKGDDGNVVRVSDADRHRRQLVLLVQEGRREFVERLMKRRITKAEVLRLGRLVRETEDEWHVQRATSSLLRRFLCGMDESHYFIAQFAGGTTVRDAHRELKPVEVREAERSHAGRTLRQGEWFFLPLSQVDKAVLSNALEESPYLVHRFESLGGNGRPHVADEVVRLGQVYARGAIRHPDHKTLVLDGWRRVHRNAEVRTSGETGVYWYD